MSTRGKRRDAVERELRVHRVPANRAPVELGVPVRHGADEAPERREERLHGRRARLGERGRAVDPVVDDDEHAASGRVLVRRHRHRVVEVERAVGRQGRRGAHRRGQDDGLARLGHEVEEVRRLLDRVGAVRDDDAVHVLHRGELVDAARELEPDLVVHVLRADVGDLLALEVRELLGLRHGGEELLDADLARRVAGLDVARGGAGDRAARREHDDVRKRDPWRAPCRLRRGRRRDDDQDGQQNEGRLAQHGEPPTL